MTNKEFDQWLKESLSDQHPDANPGDWDSFVKRIEDSETTTDTAFDQQIRAATSGLGAESIPDWTRMEGMLDVETQDFDDHVRNSVEHIEVPYNAKTWPVLDARLSMEERTRRRVIVAKVFEIAAILVALFTFYNLFPVIQDRVHPATESLRPERSLAGQESVLAETALALSVGQNDASDQNGEAIRLDANPAIHSDDEGASHDGASRSVDRLEISSSTRPDVFIPALSSASVMPEVLFNSTAVGATFDQVPDHVMTTQDAQPQDVAALSLLASRGLGGLDSEAAFSGATIPAPVLHKPSKVRFGMMAAADINTLYVPDEFFYSQGRAIRFSEKEIEAGGYTAGASLLFDQPRFLVETGITYSSKTFGPDRTLFIGTSPDQHELDFENITLDVVSVPLYLHLKIDGKGLWRFYTVGGASLHVIANAHYDLVAENTNPPASAAPLDPTQLQNQREIQRVREHMLDGAKFNSKAYLTAAGGFGIERFLNSRISVFAQPMYHYQISFFGLIDQNGKHLRSTSLLLGTRISL